jgi:hypothetical protein
MGERFALKFPKDVALPFLIRVLPRAGSWGLVEDKEEAVDVRVARIAQEVFAPDAEGAVSMWQIETPLDFRRVSFAYNAHRKHPLNDLYVVAITKEELAGLPVNCTDGGTDCLWANRLHRNVHIENQSETLAGRLVAAKRDKIKLTKVDMKEAQDESTRDGCHSNKANSPGCVCEVAQ